MFPELDSKQVADEVVDYFGAESDLLPALDWAARPVGHGGPDLDPLSRAQVAAMLQKAKKPSSMVTGDIYPSLYGNFDLSKMVTPVLNQILSTRI